MSFWARKPHSARYSVALFSLLILLQSLIIFIPVGDIAVSGEEEPTRSGDIEIDMDSVANFDIQYMVAPDQDELSELRGKKWAKLSPGSSGIYWIIITNMGPVNDTYRIKLADPPRDAGWNWYFYNTRSLTANVTLTSPHIRDLVRGISFKTFRIMVEVPIDATRITKVPLKVSALSESLFSDVNAEVYEDYDELIIVIGSCSHLRIVPYYPLTHYVDPGEPITIRFPITNLGHKDSITIDYKVIEGDFWRTSYRDWEDIYIPNSKILNFNWTEKPITVYQGQTAWTELEVSVDPFIADYVDVYQFRIFGSIRGAPNFYQSSTLTLIVNMHTTLEAEINNGEQIDIIPGEENHINLSISNSGWQDDVIKDIYLVESDGVKLTSYNWIGNITDRFVVRTKGTKIIDLGFHLEKDLPPGRIERQVFIRPMYDDPIILNITLNVQEKTDIDILSPDTYFSDVIEMGPGEEKSVTFGIRNNGNTEQIVYPDMMRAVMRYGYSTPVPHEEGWETTIEWISQVCEPVYMIGLEDRDLPLNSFELEDEVGYLIEKGISRCSIPISIGPGETIWVGYKVKNPGMDENGLISPYPIKLVLSSQNDTILDEMDLVIDVKYPDLQFDDMLRFHDENGRSISLVKEEETVFFTMNVTNTGEWYSERTLVNIMANDRKIDDLWIIPLAPGQTTLLMSNFTVEDGCDSIELEIDPNNDLIELDDQFMEGSVPDANKVRAPLTVRTESSMNVLDLALSIFLFIFLVGISTGIGVILYTRMKKVTLMPKENETTSS